MATKIRSSDEYSLEDHEKHSLERSSLSSDAPLKEDGDIEAQETAAIPPAAAPAEYSVSTSKKLVFLCLYFFLSLGLTLSNKAVMSKVCTTPTIDTRDDC